MCFILGGCAESAQAEALDGSENVVGGLGPSERLGIGISGIDVSFDSGFEVGDGSEDAASEGALGEQCEEASDC